MKIPVLFPKIFDFPFTYRSEISEHLNTILEKLILKNPDQWIWTHNRWK